MGWKGRVVLNTTITGLGPGFNPGSARFFFFSPSSLVVKQRTECMMLPSDEGQKHIGPVKKKGGGGGHPELTVTRLRRMTCRRNKPQAAMHLSIKRPQ